MKLKKYNSLDEVIIYKNIQLIQTSIHIFIISKMLYGNQSDYSDIKFIENITPIIKTYKSSLFKGNNGEIYVDLLINVDTIITKDNTIQKNNDNFTLTLSTELDNGVKNLRIINVELGDKIREFSKIESLSENLVPYIYEENYEHEAQKFLSKYYPEALLDPIPINIETVIKNMNLKLEYLELEKDVRGMITFRNIKANKTDYTAEGALVKEISIDKGTIVINDRLLYERGIGAYHSTLIHECLHWHLHKSYMELQIILNDIDPSLIRYVDDEEKKYDKDLYHIENQVRQITPLILMPRESSITKFEQLIAKYKDDIGLKEYQMIYKASLKEFALYFNVSMESARIRLFNLGYTENLYANSLDYETYKNQVRFISRWDYERLILTDTVFNNLVENKVVKYINGYVVINLKPYVEQTVYGDKISDYGLKNITECTITFEIKRNRNFGFRKSNPTEYSILHYELIKTATQISVNKDQIKVIIKKYEKTDDLIARKEFFRDFRMAEPNFSYSEYLHILMERHEKSVNQLVISSGLSVSLIKKYRAMSEVTYTLEATLTICAALKLYPYESLNLLKLMGWDYEGTIQDGGKLPERYKHYYNLIINEFDSGLDYWNKYLENNKIKSLP